MVVNMVHLLSIVATKDDQQRLVEDHGMTWRPPGHRVIGPVVKSQPSRTPGFFFVWDLRHDPLSFISFLRFEQNLIGTFRCFSMGLHISSFSALSIYLSMQMYTVDDVFSRCDFFCNAEH